MRKKISKFTSLLLFYCVFFLVFVTGYGLRVTGDAGQIPSLFRGVVVADSPLGVRIVSVQPSSQAFFADLRPEDIIVRVQNTEVRTIDEFAMLSKELKGRLVETVVLVFRNGLPREIPLHLYSYPLLQTWGIRFIPDYDFRFAEPEVGRNYWARLGRGFKQAEKDKEALDAYLNGLHNAPEDVAVAIEAAVLFTRLGQRHIRKSEFIEGFASLRRGLIMLRHLFNYHLRDAQLETIRDELRSAITALREAKVEFKGKTS